jgi:nucleoside phosphorylase
VTNIDPETNLNAGTLIAVTFALPEESKYLVAKLQGTRKLEAGALPVITGELGGRRIAICHTGVGAESCKARITSFLREHHPASLISSGFAGGLDPVLKVGDVIIAGNFSSDALLVKAGTAQVLKATMTTQPQVAESVADKAALFSQTGATAVDMETGIIFAQCAERGIPMISLRGISDSALDELPVSFSIWFDAAKQKPRVGALLWNLATHPAKIPRFAKFVRGINFTRARLTDALVTLIGAL